jgi:hypothetical protein
LNGSSTIPRRFGAETDRYTLGPGAVCDPCNHWLGRQVDAPFTDRFDITLSRGLERLRDRRDRSPTVIEGRDATARLDLELGGGRVTVFAARADETDDGGLDIEILPKQRDPPEEPAERPAMPDRRSDARAAAKLLSEGRRPMTRRLRAALLGAAETSGAAMGTRPALKDLYHRAQHGWPASFPLVQFPNLPIIIAVVGALVAAMTDDSAHDAAQATFYAALAAWAWLELTDGVNWLKRVVGAAGFLYVIVKVSEVL